MNNFKFALVTADKANSIKIKMRGDRDDCTGFMNWLDIWDGVHYSFDAMKNDFSPLFNYDCVMMSGHPYYLSEIITISSALKGKAVTIFLPEGDVSQYDLSGINSFNPTYYKALRSIDIVAIMEEDKVPFYSLLTSSLVRFIHVPIDARMAEGKFFIPRERKDKYILVYGDNNPNCPTTVFALAAKLDKPIVTVVVSPELLTDIRQTFNVTVNFTFGKLGQYPFLELLGKSRIHIYPTRWIGSAREPIACAVAGTPCIGSDRSHTQRRLFPKLACDIYDVTKMLELANKLYNDNAFYDEIVGYAWKQLPFYNMENTKKRFTDAYEEVRKLW